MSNRKISELDQIVDIASGDSMLITDISEATGSKSKKITIQQLEDLIAQFTIAASPLGEMNVVDNSHVTNIVAVNEWVKVENFSHDVNFLRKVNFADNSLVMQAGGTFLFNGSMAGERASGGADDYEIALFINGIIVPKTRGARNFTNAIGSLGSSGFLNLYVGDTLEVKIRNISGNTDFIVRNVNINIHGI